MHSPIMNCRACKSVKMTSLLSLGNQSFTGIFPKDDNSKIPEGPLELIKCDSCNLVQLAHSFNLNELFGQNYGYRSGLNGSMVRHLNDKVRRILAMIDLNPRDLVVDIGSNDGTTLRAYPDRNLTLVGIDPSGAKFRNFYPSDVELIPDFFSSSLIKARFGSKRATIITSFAMFYDLEDPMQFMREVEEILADNGIWVFEQSYLPAMLETNSYDTICHEHLEYYALTQINQMAKTVGLKIVDIEFNDVNGGSFSVTAAKVSSSRQPNQASIDKILNEEDRIGLFALKTYQDFAQRVVEHRKLVRQFFDWCEGERLRVLGYGASTKGNVLLQYCGITGKQMPAIAEVNEDKFGSFTPGTLIPIVSEATARRMHPDLYFVLPWHFKAGILSRETKFIGSGGQFIFPLPQLCIEPANNAFSKASRPWGFPSSILL